MTKIDKAINFDVASLFCTSAKQSSASDFPETDAAMSFLCDKFLYHQRICLVAKYADGQNEVHSWDEPWDEDQDMECRRFIRDHLGKANIFVCANDLKQCVNRLPARDDIGAVMNLAVRISPNPHLINSPQMLMAEQARIADRVKTAFWYFEVMVSRSQISSEHRPSYLIHAGTAYWLCWHFAVPRPLDSAYEPDPDFLCHDNDTSFDPYRYDREITSPFTFEMLAEELARDLGCDVLWRELKFLKPIEALSDEDRNNPLLRTSNEERAKKHKFLLDRYGPPVETVNWLLPLPGTLHIPTADEVRIYGCSPTVIQEVREIADTTLEFAKRSVFYEDLTLTDKILHDENLTDHTALVDGRVLRDRISALLLTDKQLFEIWTGSAKDAKGCRLSGQALTNALVAKLKEHRFPRDDAEMAVLCYQHGHVDYFAEAWGDKPSATKGPPWFRELNDKHFTVVESGKPFVCTPRYDPALKRQVLERSSHREFEEIYSGRRSAISKARTVSIGKLWLELPDHRHYPNGVTFMPGQEAPTGMFNLWTGWGYPPAPGDWSKLRKHILENVCNGNQAQFDYLLRWMASAIQNPGDPGHVAVVLRGGRGVGKGKLAVWLGKLFGQHWVHIASGKLLVGNFNAHLRDAAFVFADEAIFAGDKAHESVLKALITEQYIMIEAKFQNAVMAKNCVHLMIASNDEWVVPAGFDERRFFVLDVAAHHQKDSNYFAAIDEQMEQGGAAGMLCDLQHMDLKGFDVRKVPNTAGLTDQKLRSLDDFASWLHGIFDEGDCPGVLHGQDWRSQPIKVSKGWLYQDYAKQSQAYRAKTKSQFGKLLKEIIPGLQRHRPRANTGSSADRKQTYILPPLEECRAAFEKFIGSKIDWQQ